MSQRHWTTGNESAFQYALAFSYVTQIQDALDEEKISRKEFADVVGVSESRMSQLMNSPGNLTLATMVRLALNIGRKVSVVLYDDGDSSNALGPVDAELFTVCWSREGRPRDFASVGEWEEHRMAAGGETWGSPAGRRNAAAQNLLQAIGS